MTEPTKTTVYLDPEDYRRLKALAKSQGRTAAELVREAVAVYARSQPLPTQPSSIAAGRSGRGDLSERAESLLDGMGRDR
jgi:predicted transcriptional regulator